MLVQWNQALFDHLIPNAWAEVLEVLVRSDRINNVLEFWPIPAAIHAGSSDYWASLLRNVLNVSVSRGDAVWPTISFDDRESTAHYRLDQVLIVSPSTSPGNSILRILTSVGLLITLVPPSAKILEKELSNLKSQYLPLCPKIAADKLKVRIRPINTFAA